MWPRAVSYSSIAGADLVAWRRRQLGKAGFAPATAAALAESDVDLHALGELLDAGCPPHLAVRIMAPLELELPR